MDDKLTYTLGDYYDYIVNNNTLTDYVPYDYELPNGFVIDYSDEDYTQYCTTVMDASNILKDYIEVGIIDDVYYLKLNGKGEEMTPISFYEYTTLYTWLGKVDDLDEDKTK